MKKSVCLRAFAVLLPVLLLAACGGAQAPAGQEEQVPPGGANVEEEMIPFEIGTPLLVAGSDNTPSPYSVVLGSVAEVEDFYRESRDLFGLDGPAIDGSAFLDASRNFDEEFFKDNSLILVFITESSGSVSHEVTGVRLMENGALQVDVLREVPDGMGDTMMAYRCLFISLEGRWGGRDAVVQLS